MTTRCLLLWSALLLVACAGDESQSRTALGISFVKSQDYTAVPKERGSQVKLFTAARPDRKFTEVGVLSVRDTTFERMIWFARQRAARLGCDALYQVESSKIVSSVSRTGPTSAEPEYETIGRFACLIWDD